MWHNLWIFYFKNILFQKWVFGHFILKVVFIEKIIKKLFINFLSMYLILNDIHIMHMHRSSFLIFIILILIWIIFDSSIFGLHSDLIKAKARSPRTLFLFYFLLVCILHKKLRLGLLLFQTLWLLIICIWLIVLSHVILLIHFSFWGLRSGYFLLR